MKLSRKQQVFIDSINKDIEKIKFTPDRRVLSNIVRYSSMSRTGFEALIEGGIFYLELAVKHPDSIEICKRIKNYKL